MKNNVKRHSMNILLLIIISSLLSVITAGCRQADTRQTPGPTLQEHSLSGISQSYPRGVSLGPPTVVDPKNFKIELFADLKEFPRNWTFDLTLTKGENSFPPGLYIPGGPSFAPDQEKKRLLRVDKTGKVSTVSDRLEKGIEIMVFARGKYGDGILVSELQSLRIVRVLPDGTISTFAQVGTAPLGPTQMNYGSDGLLYVPDYTSGNLMRVYPDGKSEVYATVPVVARGRADVAGRKGNAEAQPMYQAGGGFITSTFSTRSRNAEPHKLDTIHIVSIDGRSVKELAAGFSGIEFLNFGPGGIWGSELYVSAQGTDLNGDGGVYIVKPDGKVEPFITGIDATDVVFDTEGILGGGMFVGDMYNPWGAPDYPSSKIWRVVPK